MRNRSLVLLLAVSLAAGALFISTATRAATPDPETAKERYVSQVVSILRSQVTAMRYLIGHDIEYSDNVVRHAAALGRTFGMLGPMEWHAANAFLRTRGHRGPDSLTEEQFDELAEQSQDAVNYLARSARRYLRDGDQERMLGSINAMMASCGACHSKLPKGSVPTVWKGMKE